MIPTTTPSRRAFSVRWQDLEKWDALSTWLGRGITVNNPLRRLSEIMRVRWHFATDEEITSGAVSMVDRVSFNGEIFAGQKQQTKMVQFIAFPGDLVISKIRARQGSIGLVESKHGPVGVTIHYRVLTPDPNCLNGLYGWLALRSSYCRAQFLAATGGAMKGEISEASLLAIRIPLPTLAEQRAIVSRWREAQQEIAQARDRRKNRKIATETRFFADLGLKSRTRHSLPNAFAVLWKDFHRWGVNFNQLNQTGTDLTHGRYRPVSLDSIVELVQYGTSEKANSSAQGIAVIRMNNIVHGELDLSNLKYLQLPEAEVEKLLLRDGDILFNRTNSKELVGKCAVFHAKGDYVFASYLIRVRPDFKKANPDFLAYVINCPIGRQQIDALSRQIIGQANVNSKELLSLQIPLPPLSVQSEIIQRVANGRAKSARDNEAMERIERDINRDIEALILGSEKP
jgi:type I restriction enzyme, S subunit